MPHFRTRIPRSRFTGGKKKIFNYNKQPTKDAEQAEPYYLRTGYIHPLYSPSDKVVTGDYASDHPHPHGLFFAWTKTSFRGKPTEFWNQKKQLGDIRLNQFHGTEDKGRSRVGKIEQIYTKGKDSDEPILRETWEISVPEQKKSYNVFDLTSTQTCATKDPLQIHKYHYGGMAIRGNAAWIPPTKDEAPVGKMLTSEGLTRENGNHARPRWVALYGPIDGVTCGVAALANPDNFRAPQWVRLHPSKPYFVFAPMVEEPVKIEPGKPYISKFRYVTFDGEPDTKVLDGIWKEFAEK